MPIPTSTATPEFALELLRKNKSRKVAELCDTGLASEPESDAWLHVRGLILINTGDFAGAEVVLNRAIARNRSVATYHHALGNALHSMGKTDRAITCYRRALRLNPQLAEAHNDLGTAYFDKHWLKEAEASFSESARLKPDHEAALSNLGATLRAEGRITEARVIFQRVLGLRIRRALGRVLPFLRHSRESTPAASTTAAMTAQRSDTNAVKQSSEKTAYADIKKLIESGDLDAALKAAQSLHDWSPSDPEINYVLALTLAAMGKDSMAIEYYSRAIALDSTVARYHNNLGITLHKQKFSLEAEACYRRAIELDPNMAIAHNNLAAALRDQDEFEVAIEACQTAIRLDPKLWIAHENMAEAQAMLGQFKEARASFERSIELMPTHAQSWLGLGRLYLTSVDDLKKAEECLHRAQELAPNNEEIHQALGTAARFGGRFAEAHERFHHAQRLKMTSAEAHFVDCQLYLQEGNFERGWDLYHWRLGTHKGAQFNQRFRAPLWDGSSLAGKSILVYGEQGPGDEIMFASCFPEVIKLAAKTVIACMPRLVGVFRDSFPGIEVKSMEAGWEKPWQRNSPPTDLIAPMGDLPRHMRRDAQSFPMHSGYLSADPKRAAKWAEKLRALGPGRKVGISWKGGTRHTWSTLRSLSLDHLLPILSANGTHFINLQYGDHSAEIAAFSKQTGIRIHDWPDAIEDFAETAALATQLDLTISVCTTVVHLTGALGKPAWVITPQIPEWRYGHAGDRMVWYPTARLFRQTARDDWSAVIQRVAAEFQLQK